MPQNLYYPSAEEFDEELNIDFKRIFMIFKNHIKSVVTIFLIVFSFFIVLTFILPKKYKVEADLYINKTNNSNMVDINPYAIEELGSLGGISAMVGNDSGIVNEIEILKSPLVIDKVIRDNDLVIKKRFGFIPNRKEGEYISTKAFLKKNISIENKKGTNVVTIEYKAKKPDLAYNVVSSIIANYIDVSKQLHSEKAKSDTKILEKEYTKVKGELDEKINQTRGLPQNAVSGSGNLAAMSAFSKAAGSALATMQGQVLTGTKSQIALQEETSKMTQIATKLEWAKMVEEMSDSSKVLVLKAPVQLRDFEYSSPKLIINILLGIIFGIIAAIMSVIYNELNSKKLSYSRLGDNIIYKDNKSLFNIKNFIINYKDKKIACILFDKPDAEVASLLKEYKNWDIVEAAISEKLVDSIDKNDYVVLLPAINKTDVFLYNSIKETIQIHNKQILKEILV